MLDIALHAVSFAYAGSRFALRDIDLVCAKNTVTAIAGPAGCGSTTLLRIVAGDLRPDTGTIILGSRDVTRLRSSRRPLLFAQHEADLPGRWSVRHALVAAVRQRTLDRVDRQHEYNLAVEKWRLTDLADSRLSQLSESERTLVHLATIELRRPGVLVADRLLAGMNPSLLRWAADEFFRTLRVIGTTVITAPATTTELGWADRVAVLDRGKLVQAGRPAQVFAVPLDDAVAAATGGVNVVPLSIEGNTVESGIGSWELESPPFQGSGVALVRPDEFSIARKGEESDLIFGVEEATFDEGRWLATGILSGGFLLRVLLPREVAVEKGKLLALRYDPRRFSLIARDIAMPRRSAPTDVVPSMRDTR